MIEPINECCTQRKCHECKQPAGFWRFTLNLLGIKDKSSRKPVCTNHCGEKQVAITQEAVEI